MGKQRISEARLLENPEAVLRYQEHGKREEALAFSCWLWHVLCESSGNGWVQLLNSLTILTIPSCWALGTGGNRTLVLHKKVGLCVLRMALAMIEAVIQLAKPDPAFSGLLLGCCFRTDLMVYT